MAVETMQDPVPGVTAALSQIPLPHAVRREVDKCRSAGEQAELDLYRYMVREVIGYDQYSFRRGQWLAEEVRMGLEEKLKIKVLLALRPDGDKQGRVQKVQDGREEQVGRVGQDEQELQETQRWRSARSLLSASAVPTSPAPSLATARTHSSEEGVEGIDAEECDQAKADNAVQSWDEAADIDELMADVGSNGRGEQGEGERLERDTDSSAAVLGSSVSAADQSASQSVGLPGTQKEGVTAHTPSHIRDDDEIATPSKSKHDTDVDKSKGAQKKGKKGGKAAVESGTTAQSADAIGEKGTPGSDSKRKRLDGEARDETPSSAEPASKRVKRGTGEDGEAARPIKRGSGEDSEVIRQVKADFAEPEVWQHIDAEFEKSLLALQKQHKSSSKGGKKKKSQEDDEDPNEHMEEDLLTDLALATTKPTKGTKLTAQDVVAYRGMWLFFAKTVFGESGCQKVELAVERACELGEKDESSALGGHGGWKAINANEAITGNASDALAMVPATGSTDGIFQTCVNAYRRVRMAQKDEAIANKDQHQRLAEFYRTWETLREKVLDDNSPEAKHIVEYSSQRGRQLRQGVGKASLVWSYLVDHEYPEEVLRDEAKRTSASSSLRADIAGGKRLAYCERIFGEGIFCFMPQTAGRSLRNWKWDLFKTFLILFDSNIPHLKDYCHLIARKLRDPTQALISSSAGPNTALLPSQQRVYELIQGICAIGSPTRQRIHELSQDDGAASPSALSQDGQDASDSQSPTEKGKDDRDGALVTHSPGIAAATGIQREGTSGLRHRG